MEEGVEKREGWGVAMQIMVESMRGRVTLTGDAEIWRHHHHGNNFLFPVFV